jgi:hypothetical protein
LNRSVTASINDLISHAIGWLENGDIAPHDLGFRLNDILLSTLAADKATKYGKPNDAFRLLASAYRARRQKCAGADVGHHRSPHWRSSETCSRFPTDRQPVGNNSALILKNAPQLLGEMKSTQGRP